MNSNIELVNYLVNNWILKNDNIINAFKKIDRIDFVLTEYYNEAYDDIPLPIWYWQTISQPTTVAIMLELLTPKVWNKVIDIWTWSWWTTTLLSDIVWKSGIVKWYEIIPELVKLWKNNLKKYNVINAKIEQSKLNFSFIKWKYDRILVSAWTNEIPNELLIKLKIWWIMVIPINSYIFKIIKINKENDINIEKYYWFSFVPLITN